MAVAMSDRARRAKATVDVVTDYYGRIQALADIDPDVLDFTFGNPHEMALPGLSAALAEHLEPRAVDWFAYKTSERSAQESIAAGLRVELGLPFEPDDIAMTRGAFGAISLALALLADAGDEVVIPSPGWFCYAPMLHAVDLVPVEAALDPVTFDLDVDAIARALTPRTRIVVVNSPANPTGRVYPQESWEALADVLDAASRAYGHRIWLLSDEPYRRIRFDGIGFTSPAGAYPWTVIDYSFGKVLLAPGQRLGYLALSPLLPASDRDELRAALTPVGLSIGWAFPDAVMQYAAPELETLSIDMPELTRRRNRLHGALAGAGFDVMLPEGTFYLWGRAPGGDAAAYCAALADRGVFVLPGSLFDHPRHIRISLTATMEMIDRAIPHLVEVAGEFPGDGESVPG